MTLHLKKGRCGRKFKISGLGSTSNLVSHTTDFIKIAQSAQNFSKLGDSSKNKGGGNAKL